MGRIDAGDVVEDVAVRIDIDRQRVEAGLALEGGGEEVGLLRQLDRLAVGGVAVAIDRGDGLDRDRRLGSRLLEGRAAAAGVV